MLEEPLCFLIRILAGTSLGYKYEIKNSISLLQSTNAYQLLIKLMRTTGLFG